VRLDPSLVDEAQHLYEVRDSKTMFGAALAWAMARNGRRAEALQMCHAALEGVLAPTTDQMFFVATLNELGEDALAERLVQADFARGFGRLPLDLRDPWFRTLSRVPAIAWVLKQFDLRR
jgi:hypothetical protein